MNPLPPTSTLFPYTTLFRSDRDVRGRLRRLRKAARSREDGGPGPRFARKRAHVLARGQGRAAVRGLRRDRKSTRLNSSHLVISYAVFCLKKKNTQTTLKIRA